VTTLGLNKYAANDPTATLQSGIAALPVGPMQRLQKIRRLRWTKHQ